MGVKKRVAKREENKVWSQVLWALFFFSSPLVSRSLALQSNTMSKVEVLSSSSDDDSLDFDSAEELSVDPLADFEKVNHEDRSPELQSREAAAAGTPADFTNPDDVEKPAEEVLTVEELPEEEMKSVRCFYWAHTVLQRFPSLLALDGA